MSVDGATTRVSSRADTVAEVLQARGLTVGQHDVVAPATSAPVADGTRVAVEFGRRVTVYGDGRPRTGWTTGRTVADALKAAKVTVAADDRLSSKPTAPLSDGTTLTYTRVDTRTLTQKKLVSYDTVRHRTGTLKKAVTKVKTSGRPGTRTVTYREVRHNGQVARVQKVASVVTTKPRTQVVLVASQGWGAWPACTSKLGLR